MGAREDLDDPAQSAVPPRKVTRQMDQVAHDDGSAPQFPCGHTLDGGTFVEGDHVAPSVDCYDLTDRGFGVVGPTFRSGARTPRCSDPHSWIVSTSVAVAQEFIPIARAKDGSAGLASPRSIASQRCGNSGSVLSVVAIFWTRQPGTARPTSAPKIAMR